MSDLSPIFIIGHIYIGSVEDASCVNIGNNLPIGFEAYRKQSQGFGEITGDHNDIREIEARLKDSHVLDMLNQSGGEEVPHFIKNLIKSKMVEDDDE
jgi:hypothetical protein